MNSRTTLATAVALTGIALFSTLRLAPAQESASSTKRQICGEYDAYIVRRLDSAEQEDFCETYKNKVVLVVNTASRCGYTYQYEDLEKLYSVYRNRGLVVVGFPSNDFANQEPGKEQSIKTFCRLTYGVKFPMYAKTRVKGQGANPLYRTLADAAGQSPSWNFHKYLIGRDGRLTGSFGSSVEPRSDTIVDAIEQQL